MRADASKNRERILGTTRRLFTERGIDVPMATVARHAGVGVATLYRHFPTRESLVNAVFATEFATCAGVLDTALADSDPWRAFRTAIERVCAMQAADRGFSAAFLAAFPGSIDVEREQNRAFTALAELTARAKASGRLRADFDTHDLVLVLLANRGVVGPTPADTRAASRRLVAYLLDGFRADRATPLPPPARLELLELARTP